MRKIDMVKWKTAKGSLKDGVPVDTVAKILDVSPGTIYAIGRSKSFAGYKREVNTWKRYKHKHVMGEYIKTPVPKPKVTKLPWYKRLFT